MVGGSASARVPRRWRVALTLASIGATAPVLWMSGSASAHIAAVILMAVQGAALWWLVDRPWQGTAAVLAISAVLQVMFPSYGPGIAFVVLCTYAWLRPAAETLWMLALAVPAVCGPAVARERWDLAGLWLGAVLLAWSWGALMRARGERRVAERRQAVLEERARIARDLHDVLSHTVSVMVIQAAAADDVFESNPAKAREALRRTEEAGRLALAELRGFLRTVRADSGADEAGPQPTLADVPLLAERVGETGLAVTLLKEGEAEVPLGVQVGAYRIVQEALTNTLKHSAASRADVHLRYWPDELEVEIVDDGRPSATTASAPGGLGLIGMRERAVLHGGQLSAGPSADGGFAVRARLPTPIGAP